MKKLVQWLRNAWEALRFWAALPGIVDEAARDEAEAAQ